MNQKTAQIIFITFNLLALPIVAFVFYEFYQVNSAISRLDETIPFDSGLYYLLLASVFWVMGIIQYVGKKGGQGKQYVEKYASVMLVGWFIGILVSANLIPFYLQEKINKLAYIPCDDPREVSRLAKGVSIIYSKTDCNDL